MTEDEAKTKWCPFARVAYDGFNGNRFCAEEHNRIALNPASSRCIGSNCMAWRWKIELLKITPKTGHSYITNKENVNFVETGAVIEKIEKEGYCGLAGKQ